MPASVSTSPAPIIGSARFASGARSPDAPSDPCSGTDGDHVCVQHLHHQVHELGAHARVTEREDVRAEEQHRARLRAGQRAPDRGRVRTDDPVLQVRCLRGIDPHVGECAEPGGDPVDDVAGRDRILDHSTRGGDRVSRGAEGNAHVGARRDRATSASVSVSPTATVTAAKATTEGEPSGP